MPRFKVIWIRSLRGCASSNRNGRAVLRSRVNAGRPVAHACAHRTPTTKFAMTDTELAHRHRLARRPRDRRSPCRDRRKCGDVHALAACREGVRRTGGIPVAIGGRATRRGAAQFNATAAHAAIRTAKRRCTTSQEDVMQLVNFAKSFVSNDEGQDLLEYALLVALIALVAIAAVTAAGGSVSAIFTSIAGKLGGAAS